MSADPVDQIVGLTSDADTADVEKSGMRSYLKGGVVGWFASCSDVRGLILTSRQSIMVGTRFFRKNNSDLTADDMTETTPAIVDLAGNHFQVIEGERYDISFSTTGLLGDDEKLPAFPIVIPLLLPAGLPGSIAYFSGAASTGAKTVTFESSTDYGASWSTAFTAAVLAGGRALTFTLASDLSLAGGSLLRPRAPATHDPTAAGFTATIAALR